MYLRVDRGMPEQKCSRESKGFVICWHLNSDLVTKAVSETKLVYTMSVLFFFY